ncbi:gliding motility-associated C-terminal domain-containing protein [Zunongwangia endophytica]|uniref:Gliding motility-associated C-terminal domain-containing protein n=1 Tax=Zunongwangia endophytica TaxID=1808945 RepID=A0ABV8H5G8_9FLAO
MQNFTLRIRGTKLFLLSFVLFMGGLSMHGQQAGCPTAANTDQNQTFCYLQTVGEIETDGTTVYRTQDSENPIPSNELLENGATYFVGNADGDCTSRIAVTTTVNSAPAPVSGYGTTFSPTLGSSADSFDVDDLISTLVDDNPGMTLVVFADQYDTNSLPGNTTLIAENSYWVGQTGNVCPSERLAIRYDPIIAEAPTGDAQQTFCPEATVADLVANGTSANTQAIRWYSTATSNPALDDDVILVDGETYYATQVINNVGSPLPPTESEDRFEVTVTVIEPVNAGDDNTAALCSIEAALDLSTLISVDADTDGTFTLNGTDLNGQFDPSNYADGDYTVIYSVEDECTSDEATFTITVTEQPDAPVIADVEFCETDNATVADLGTDANVSIYDDAALTTELTPSTVLQDGTYFAVANDGSCTSETTDFEVTISEQPDAPIIASQTFCENDNATVADLGTDATVAVYDDAALTTELEPTTPLATGTYYAVATNGSCVSDDTEFDVTITPAATPEAGDDNSFDVCINDTIELTDYLSSDAITTGTFAGNGVSGTQFSVSTAGDYTITYTVNSTNSCITSGSDSATFTITVNTPADANAGEDMDFDACVNESIDLVAYLSDDAITSGEFTGDGVTDGMFMATTAGNYTVTYTIDEDDSCVNAGTSDSATFTITVNTPADANAGEDMDFDACVNESIDLVAYLSDDAITSGEFTGDGVTDGMFMATTAGNYTVTYTIDEDDSCVNAGTSDSATFTITVNTLADANAGEDIEFTSCVDQTIDLFTYLSEDALTSGDFTGDGVTDGMFTATEAGAYTVTYTVDEGDPCVNTGTSDSASFTINVFSTDSIGEIQDQTFCSNVETDLYSILEDGVNNTGTFEGYANGLFNETTPGDYEITYSLDETAPCVDGPLSTTFTVTVLETVTAGENMTVVVCANDETIILADYLSADATNGGNFTNENNATVTEFDPSAAGDFIFTYTVTTINECGNENATLTITVNELPDAPSVTDLSFCAIDGATVADLAVTGNGVTYYSEAEAEDEDMLDATDVLTSGTYYATQMNASGCESETAAINVTVNDPETPVIDDSDFQICEFDERTISYLTDGITSGGEITWYDSEEGGQALSEGLLLEDGMTYYASTFDSATGCESAIRRAYTVNFTDCELIFQEGISPNGDGMNDTFDIQYLADEYPNYVIEIYNRWGNMVYKGNTSTPNWDGTSTESSVGDNVLPVGVYFYVIEFNDGATPAKQGRVYLSR